MGRPTMRLPVGLLTFGRVVAAAAIALFACRCAAAPLVLKDDYRSPRNKERPFRKSTRLIVLHTTEAHAKSSLNKLCERGEAHYCVTEKGEVYRIVDRDREAFHAGRSMWNAKEDCDEFSVGIEVVGHHDKTMPLVQLEALRELVDRLKKIYNIKDEQVVCHSHVAYGAPNTWHKKKHRGRKRCGMLFAMPSVRAKLGLKARPASDPDVKAKRLVQADSYLESVLYGKVDTMTAFYGKPNILTPARPTAVALAAKPHPAKPPTKPPAKPAVHSVQRVAAKQPAKPVTPPPVVKPPLKSGASSAHVASSVSKPVIPPPIVKPPLKPGVPSAQVAASAAKPVRPPVVKPPLIVPNEKGDSTAEESAQAEKLEERGWLTVLGLKGGFFKKRAKIVVPKEDTQAEPEKPSDGNVLPLPENLYVGRMGDDVKDLEALAKLPGYTRGGPVSAELSPYKIAGAAWKSPTTYYYSPRGRITTGDKVDEKSIEAGTFLFFKK